MQKHSICRWPSRNGKLHCTKFAQCRAMLWRRFCNRWPCNGHRRQYRYTYTYMYMYSKGLNNHRSARARKYRHLRISSAFRTLRLLEPPTDKVVPLKLNKSDCKMTIFSRCGCHLHLLRIRSAWGAMVGPGLSVGGHGLSVGGNPALSVGAWASESRFHPIRTHPAHVL